MKKIELLFVFTFLIMIFGGCSNSKAKVERPNNLSGSSEQSETDFCLNNSSTPYETVIQQSDQAVVQPGAVDQFFEVGNKYLEEHADELLGYWWLPSGGVLLAHIDSERSDKDFTFIEWVVLDYSNGTVIQENWTYLLQVCGYKPDAVHIFYDEDWESKIYNKETMDCTYYDSCFLWHNGEKGTDVIISIIPNVQKNLMGPAVPYEETDYYQQVPIDSLGTTPIEITYPYYNYNYPQWIFVIDKERIDDSYELHYMDYVLTGDDLLNRNWSIGNAPPLISQSEDGSPIDD